MVIIIAVLVGGLISGFCIGVIIYMVCKAVKKNREERAKNPDRDGRQGMLGESPDQEEEEDEGPTTVAG
jgi:hypothetical protein